MKALFGYVTFYPDDVSDIWFWLFLGAAAVITKILVIFLPSEVLIMIPIVVIARAFIPSKYRFTLIKNANFWGSSESKSGTGSDIVRTQVISQNLGHIIKEYDIKSILDCPCGDMNFMKEIFSKDPTIACKYSGMDIVPELIKENKIKFPDVCFIEGDLSKLNKSYDLIIVKDLLQHLRTKTQLEIICALKESGSKYLLINHEPHIKRNLYVYIDPAPLWIKFNLTLEPFNFKPVKELKSDGFDKNYILVKLNE